MKREKAVEELIDTKIIFPCPCCTRRFRIIHVDRWIKGMRVKSLHRFIEIKEED